MSDEVVNPFDLEGLFLVEVTSGSGKKKKVTGYAVCERIAFLPEIEVSKKGKDGDAVVLENGSTVQPLLDFARLAFERNRKDAFAAINVSNGYPKGGTIQNTGNQGLGPSGVKA
jgi:hypothetical protein